MLALGAVPNFRDLPGVAANALTLATLEDARRLRDHVLGRLEQADHEPDPAERRRWLTFVVAGGGFAGTEAVASLFDLVHSVLRYFPPRPRPASPASCWSTRASASCPSWATGWPATPATSWSPAGSSCASG